VAATDALLPVIVLLRVAGDFELFREIAELIAVPAFAIIGAR
jgi:hypothetical protein